MQTEMQISSSLVPPRHPDSPSPDLPFDQELHANLSAPPPPPPPPVRHKSKDGSSRQNRSVNVVDSSRDERKTMVEGRKESQPSPVSPPSESREEQQPLEREPLNSLNSLTPADPYDHPQKEHSSCDPNVEFSDGSPTKHTKNGFGRPPPSKGKLPPKQPGGGSSSSKGAEYSSRIESFHQVMLDNIEKETQFIRNVGSFQYHHNNLSNKDKSRRNSSSGQGEETENDNSVPSSSGEKQRSGVNPTTDHTSNVDLLRETMNDISIAAASTMKTMKSAIRHAKEHTAKNGGIVVGGTVLPINLNGVNVGQLACGSIHATAFDESFLEGDEDDIRSRSKNTGATSILNQQTPMSRTGSGTELMKRVKDVIHKVVVDATNTGTAEGQVAQPNDGDGNDPSKQDQNSKNENDENNADAWGVGNILANGFGFYEEEDDDDARSRATYDTWDDENSVLRRLGSWGTVNSQFTAGTAGTFGTLATYDTEGPSVIGPVSVAVAAANKAKLEAGDGDGEMVVGPDGRRTPQNGDQLVVPGSHQLQNASKEGLLDDDGSLIDPALVEAALKKQKEKDASKKKKRRKHRKRLVKFDYPPVKSLRQYTRPNPEDLPNLFFTEEELDQIEDDRYSTMSTDDIEIVAVSSKETSGGGDKGKVEASSPKKKGSAERGRKNEKDQDYEPGYKPVKGRSGTPTRRRSGEGGKQTTSKQSPGAGTEETAPPAPPKNHRLVKGVQIYLRERSTGT